MRAMVLTKEGSPLVERDLPLPSPGDGELLLRVTACGVCRTDLHVADGDLAEPALPLTIGHEIVGVVEATGPSVAGFQRGDRVGVPWLGGTCGRCRFCLSGSENLCDNPVFTGYQKNGGYAEYVVADSQFSFPLPDNFSDVEAAPLLCAGLIGWRSYKFTGLNSARSTADAPAGARARLGLYGFGAAAHILIQVANHQGRDVYAFTRPGDGTARGFALSLGAAWAGGSDEVPPESLDAAIIFAPAGHLVPAALKAVRKGGVVVCGGIHMTDIPTFPYELLWGERQVRSVANLTRQDALEFLAVASAIPVKTEVAPYSLARANEALSDLRQGKVRGAAVLIPGG